MNVGIFIPIGNNGWLISENAPQYHPTFALNKQIVLEAERYGVDFALSMIKLRGFGGKTEFWDHNLESFTLMAGLAAVTSRIGLFATSATLTMPPAIVARMTSTIDSISGGRFGVNLVTGWQRPEYAQMGLWPGDQFFGNRYEYLAEYVQVLRDLWGTGKSDFKGHVTSYVLFMIIADETDAAARAKWEHYKDGADHEALAWLTQQSAADTRSGSDTNVRQMADPTSAVNINMGTLVGSYDRVARMLDEVAEVPGTEGVLLTFDHFVAGVQAFGERIQPLMKSRVHVDSPVPSRAHVDALSA